MYEAGTAAEVRSFHVMPGMPPPEGERHSHDYRLEVVASRDDLDERGMVVDLDVLDRALRGLVDLLRDADLDQVVGPETGAEAVTVEVFAGWVHRRLAEAIGPVRGTELSVRVWESPVAFGGYRAPTDGRG
ncbi:MAG TPA: 6-carboxytetrahydropterin synthase [Pilimelia sp.]|nr:6-carboxytetrahydropterin synthase [Pilimelia sp.]